MRLIRFKAKKVHGYMDFNIPFRPDLTFLTGINGSGKTTALKAITALISPSLDILATLEYDHLEIEIELDGKKSKIGAKYDKKNVTLYVNEDELQFVPFPIDPDEFSPRQAEYEEEYYRELVTNRSTHPVLSFIAALPTPMFLGLDRRTKTTEDSPSRRLRWRRERRNLIGSSLSPSLRNAVELAETSYRDSLIGAGQMVRELQSEMLLRLLEVQLFEGFSKIAPPTQAERSELRRLKADLDRLPDILDLPKDQVKHRVAPFLDTLERYAKLIPSDAKNLDEIWTEEGGEPSPASKAVLDWTFNRPQLKRVKIVSETVAAYEEKRNALLSKHVAYRTVINDFLEDSGKDVQFDERGYIYYSIAGIEGRRSILTLSSGEAQLFVLFTHLFFNQDARKANICIIDEPELSLHVQWQELFVSSVLQANPDVQYVMATHAPSIILDRLENCRDISGLPGRRVTHEKQST